MSDIIERAAQILRTHRIECTGVGEVTCACRNPSDWMSPGAYFRHVAEALADAGIIATDELGLGEG